MPARRLRTFLIPCLSILGLILLSYLLGAAVMFFRLPTSSFLEKAFRGGEAWFERRAAVIEDREREVQPASVVELKPEKAYDGCTLYTTDLGMQAFLIDMHGEVLHHWEKGFREIWPEPPHIKRSSWDSRVQIFGCHLYPNGDLLAVYQALIDTPYGYGLAKLDRDSRILWKYSANVHHDVDVGDDGTIYALTQTIVEEVPAGLEFLSPPCLVDYLVVLSPQGEELKKIPILEAFQNSPFASTLALLKQPRSVGLVPEEPAVLTELEWRKGDILHTNFASVLSSKLAPKFLPSKAGQVLISVRQLNTLAMLDISSRSVVWTARGPWRRQHDPQFLDNGHLRLFDNAGSSMGSRVLEYDPRSKTVPWSYTNEDSPAFVTINRGMSQRLPNGNTLIVNTDGGKMLEVTQDRELVWTCSCEGHLNTARRYRTEQLTFLKGGRRERP